MGRWHRTSSGRRPAELPAARCRRGGGQQADRVDAVPPPDGCARCHADERQRRVRGRNRRPTPSALRTLQCTASWRPTRRMPARSVQWRSTTPRRLRPGRARAWRRSRRPEDHGPDAQRDVSVALGDAVNFRDAWRGSHEGPVTPAIRRLLAQKTGIKLDLGCGDRKHGPDWVRDGRSPARRGRHRHDLEVVPWPLPDNCGPHGRDEPHLRARQAVVHSGTMAELHRSATGAQIFISGPYG